MAINGQFMVTRVKEIWKEIRIIKIIKNKGKKVKRTNYLFIGYLQEKNNYHSKYLYKDTAN